MHIFDEYRNLGRNNYILFIGKMMTSFGSMVFSILTLILSQKLMIKASDIALLNFVIGILGMPISILGGKLADTYSKKKVIIVCDLVSILTCVYAVLQNYLCFQFLSLLLARCFNRWNIQATRL